MKFDRTIEVLNENFTLGELKNKTQMLISQSSNKHYVDISDSHFLMVIDLGNGDNCTYAWWHYNNKCIITIGNDNDPWNDGTNKNYQMTKFFNSEESYFQESLINNIKTPWIVYKRINEILDMVKKNND